MPFPPTPEQQAILDSIASPSQGSCMVEAGAGCAKTTTLELSASRIRIPALALAFNKRIATEMSSRLPGNFTCKTMNSLGHSAWARSIPEGFSSIKLDDRKSGKLITQIAKDRRLDLTTDQWEATRALFREAQIQGLVPIPEDHLQTSLVPDTREGWLSLLTSSSSPDISSDDFDYTWEIAREALIANIQLARLGTISYDDQIYCSTMLGGSFGRFPVIFLDEDQDLNPLQIRMISQSLRPDTRLLAVGDKHQSIYAFRGAVGEAAAQLRCLRPSDSWTELPLMTSFRVPHLIASRQRAHVPLFRAFGTNPDGALHQWQVGREQGWTWTDIQDILPDPSIEVAILCRNNAPIISLAFKLIRQSIGCFILGRDISKGPVALSRKIASDDSTPTDTFRARLAEWVQSETSKALVNDNPELIERITDRSDCLLAVLEGSQATDTGQLRRTISSLFSRESGLICLSTIHRAKGLEWSAVIHLDPWRIPSKHSLKTGGRALEQELNLKYVCETRTKHTLILANLEDFH